jgi:cysteine-rich CPCC protein
MHDSTSLPGVIPERSVLVYACVSEVENQYRCPCCGCKTLEAPDAMMLCPVCWWEDDGQEDADASEIRLTVNGHLSLTEARASYARCGAADPRFLPYVRRPIGPEI